VFNTHLESTKQAGLAYDRAGEGEPLLLLHGTGGSRRHWKPLWSLLTPQREVLAVDLPGHGESDSPSDDDHTPIGYAKTVASLLDVLGIGQAHIAGVSVGGWTALELAKLGRARSVVGIGPAGLWPRRDPWSCTARLWGTYRIGRLTAPLTDRALRSESGRTRLLRGMVAKPLNLTEEEARDLIETYNSTPTFTQHLAQTRRARFRDGGAIDVPVTVVWGEEERLIPAKARREDELPQHARIVTLRGCGHLPFWDDPEAVARVILEAAGDRQPVAQRAT
jgi:pimeloyl-ACP methyl ester carboxylesterase